MGTPAKQAVPLRTLKNGTPGIRNLAVNAADSTDPDQSWKRAADASNTHQGEGLHNDQ